MSLPTMASNSIAIEMNRGDELRETWREVMSVRRSTQQFRSRLARTLPTMEAQVGCDARLGDIVTSVSVLVRILDWTMRELKDVYPPEELFEVIELPSDARQVGTDETSSPHTGIG
jgi:hypothetical protein